MGKINIKSKLNRITNWIIRKIEFFNWKYWIIYCAVVLIIGTIINCSTHFSFSNFLTHQLLLVANTTMLFYAMKQFFKDIGILGSHPDVSLLKKEPEVKAIYEKRLLSFQRSPWLLVIAFFITAFFFSCIVLLEYINLDIIGIYAIYIAGSSVLIGVYSYAQYVIFLWFIYKAGKCQFNCYDYNFYVPAESAWISQIAKTSQHLRNFFLFIGFIYVVEYSILIPADKITFENGTISLNTPNNIAFIISWIALFLLVIIAFPILNHIQYTLIVRIVNKLKDHAIGELSDLMKQEQHYSKNKKQRLSIIVTYNILIENIRQSKSYPIKRQLSYETLMLIVTFVVHFMNLISQVTSIPQIQLLLP